MLDIHRVVSARIVVKAGSLVIVQKRVNGKKFGTIRLVKIDAET